MGKVTIVEKNDKPRKISNVGAFNNQLGHLTPGNTGAKKGDRKLSVVSNNSKHGGE